MVLIIGTAISAIDDELAFKSIPKILIDTHINQLIISTMLWVVDRMMLAILIMINDWPGFMIMIDGYQSLIKDIGT